jgi:hypothetical protein
VSPSVICKEKEEEETREKEERSHLAEIHLNFEIFKNLIQEVMVICSDVFYKW